MGLGHTQVISTLESSGSRVHVVSVVARLPAVHRCSRPTRPDKARKVGYKAVFWCCSAKQLEGFEMDWLRARRWIRRSSWYGAYDIIAQTYGYQFETTGLIIVYTAMIVLAWFQPFLGTKNGLHMVYRFFPQAKQGYCVYRCQSEAWRPQEACGEGVDPAGGSPLPRRPWKRYYLKRKVQQ